MWSPANQIKPLCHYPPLSLSLSCSLRTRPHPLSVITSFSEQPAASMYHVAICRSSDHPCRWIDGQKPVCAPQKKTHTHVPERASGVHAPLDELINLLGGINRNNLSRERFYFVIYLAPMATGCPGAPCGDKFACQLAWAAGI